MVTGQEPVLKSAKKNLLLSSIYFLNLTIGLKQLIFLLREIVCHFGGGWMGGRLAEYSELEQWPLPNAPNHSTRPLSKLYFYLSWNEHLRILYLAFCLMRPTTLNSKLYLYLSWNEYLCIFYLAFCLMRPTNPHAICLVVFAFKLCLSLKFESECPFHNKSTSTIFVYRHVKV